MNSNTNINNVKKSIDEKKTSHPEGKNDHYLKEELYKLIQDDARVFDFIQEGALDGLWYWDLDNPEREWMSDKFWQVLGFKPEDKQHLVSEWQDIINKEDLNVAVENFNKHCEDLNHPYDQVVRYTHKQGHTVWIRCRGLAIRDASGKPIRMLGAHTDVTQLKVIEHELQKHDFFESIIQQAPNAMVVVGVDGEVLIVNEQTEQLFGYSASELLGKPVEDLIPQEFREGHPSKRSEFTQNPSVRKMGNGRDLKGLCKDGSTVPIEVGLNPIHVENKTYVIASIVNISDRIEANNLLEQSNKQLLEKNQELEQFAYTVSHDLKTPLVTISGFTGQLFEELEPHITERQLHKFQRILSNIGTMETLLKDLLNLSKVNAQETEFEQIDLSEVLNDVAKSMVVEIKQAKANIKPSGKFFPFQCNKNLLNQALQNLIANAIRYRVEERAPEISIEQLRVKNGLQIKVTDNGAGIDDRFHDQIFKLFERLGPGEGTGVGLAIVKSIMDKHGGKVWVESIVGEGSTFTLEFPLL